MFNCHKVAQDVAFLKADYSVQCGDPKHKAGVVFAALTIILLVGFIIHLLVRHFFEKRDFVDSPDGVKKQHEVAVPISGGLSFGLSYLLFVFVCLLIFYFDLNNSLNIQLPLIGYGPNFPFLLS